jgi:hypothetical protein
MGPAASIGCGIQGGRGKGPVDYNLGYVIPQTKLRMNVAVTLPEALVPGLRVLVPSRTLAQIAGGILMAGN